MDQKTLCVLLNNSADISVCIAHCAIVQILQQIQMFDGLFAAGRQGEGHLMNFLEMFEKYLIDL